VRLTLEQQEEIKRLYLQEKRGIQYLAKVFHSDWENIRKILLAGGITLWSRSELQSANRIHYGITKGFTGQKHSQISKDRISVSLHKNANRTVTGSKSKFIETIVGKIQGSFELAYLQKLLNEGIELPAVGSTVRTPLGLYFPDFEYPDRFIEVKSPFTWDVCQGIERNPKGVKSNKQYLKIQWTRQNVKPVEIVILSQKEVLPLFRQAIQNEKLTLEKLEYKNGKYTKI
jgi:hypothetical protein